MNGAHTDTSASTASTVRPVAPAQCHSDKKAAQRKTPASGSIAAFARTPNAERHPENDERDRRAAAITNAQEQRRGQIEQPEHDHVGRAVPDTN
jgi:hypothetical protein